ncbi:MAG: hypothetical protein PW734_04855 [Verrucomicrobium sp.]|nr:hypothetical protein [Verrucomicrobium sp.]
MRMPAAGVEFPSQEAAPRPGALPGKWEFLALQNFEMKHDGIGAVASGFRRSREVEGVQARVSALHHYQGAGRFQVR